MLALRGLGHQLDKARVNQHARDGDCQGHVGFELHRRGRRHHQRQEEERAVADNGQDRQRRVTFAQHAGHLKDHRQQLDHRPADDRRDQRRHGADQRVEDPGANPAQRELLWTFRYGRLQVGGQQAHHFTVCLGHGVADDHLALVVVAHHAEHAADAFQARGVGKAFVFQNEAQARHAVGDGDDVLFTTQRANNVVCQRSVIFCHRM